MSSLVSLVRLVFTLLPALRFTSTSLGPRLRTILRLVGEDSSLPVQPCWVEMYPTVGTKQKELKKGPVFGDTDPCISSLVLHFSVVLLQNQHYYNIDYITNNLILRYY